MRHQRLAGFVIIGLLLASFRASAADLPTSASDSHPNLVSPYQPYELSLSSFYPGPTQLAGVLLQVRINGGKPLRLVLDSGAEFIVIDAKAGKSMGLSGGSELDMVGLGTRSAKLSLAESVHVGPLSFRNCPIALVTGKVLAGADGVIPLAMFSDFHVRLDLPRKTLGLIPYSEEQGPADTSHRVAGKHDVLLVRTRLNRMHDGYVVLDTGAYCSAISREVARSLSGFLIVPNLPIAAATGAVSGHLVSSTVHFEIEGQDLVPDRVIAVDLLNLSRHYGVEVVGVLGFPDLNQHVLSIDYRSQSVKVEPKLTASPHEPDRPHPEVSTTALAFR